MAATFTILLIDDEPAVGDVLRRACAQTFPEAAIQQVHSAGEASRFFDRIEGKMVKLILLDLNLPGYPGIDFLARLRAHPTGKLFPVVVLSGADESTFVKLVYGMGAAAFTSKPFSFQGWKDYAKALKLFWYQTATVPPRLFGRGFVP